MKAIIAIALITALLLACCIEELPEEFEEYESEYFSIDIPEGWVKHEFAMPSPGEFYLECYPNEHSKNPYIELHIWNSSAEDLDEFVMYVEGVDEFPTYQDCRIAGTVGKKVMRTDSEHGYITFYFPVKTERYGFNVRYYYCQLIFRRDLSTFDDAAWNNFVERVAGSLELSD